MTNRPRGQKRRRPRQPAPSREPDSRLSMGAVQGVLVGSGVAVAIAGFWLLSTGSISTAPALLIVAYLLLIPIGLALPRQGRQPSGNDDEGRG